MGPDGIFPRGLHGLFTHAFCNVRGSVTGLTSVLKRDSVGAAHVCVVAANVRRQHGVSQLKLIV